MSTSYNSLQDQSFPILSFYEWDSDAWIYSEEPAALAESGH